MLLRPNDIVTPNRKTGVWGFHFGKEFTVLDVKGSHCRLVELGEDLWCACVALDVVTPAATLEADLPSGVGMSKPGLRPEKRP